MLLMKELPDHLFNDTTMIAVRKELSTLPEEAQLLVLLALSQGSLPPPQHDEFRTIVALLALIGWKTVSEWKGESDG